MPRDLEIHWQRLLREINYPCLNFQQGISEAQSLYPRGRCDDMVSERESSEKIQLRMGEKSEEIGEEKREKGREK